LVFGFGGTIHRPQQASVVLPAGGHFGMPGPEGLPKNGKSPSICGFSFDHTFPET
jgi:hypothetical protein